MNPRASLTLILRTLGFHNVPSHGELTQSQHFGAPNKFQSGSCKLLIATDLASCGPGVPSVDVVINYDSLTHSQDYIHRVRWAGKTILMVSQYDAEVVLRLEHTLGQKFESYPADKEGIVLLAECVDEVGKVVAAQLRDEAEMKRAGGAGKRKRKRKGAGGRSGIVMMTWSKQECRRYRSSGSGGLDTVEDRVFFRS